MTSTPSPDPYRPADGTATPTPPTGPDPSRDGAGQDAPPAAPGTSPYGPGQPPAPVPGEQPSYAAPQPQGTDGVSIAALVTGILGMALVAVGLGIAGLVRTKRSGRSGKGFAIAGIVLGAIATVAWSLVIVFFFVLATNEDVQDSFQEGFQESFNDSYQQSMGLDMVVGDCFDPPADLTSGDPMSPADCAGPHGAEVIAVDQVEATEYPGDDAMVSQIETLCLDAFSEYIGVEYADSALEAVYFHPTQASWALGDRLLLCSAATMDGSPLEAGSVAGSGL
ncbi:DUF4190 domain-containing protein [Isoptericola sp. S6320L]|uniref:DUF4190 domain-containing protein n=1 Tax=Isoptericola sp. S6320L TaxID=2926411 RepID=UPI001FF1C9BE|nr:DUF4190 domain-containing protein [Isoptericola sp. S6320L]MCK0117678.1 DUF4190 domain-containing protein [Isoptericola sp. S6320L]